MASWLPRTPLPPRLLTLSRSTEPLLPGATAALDFPGLGQLGHFVAISTDAPAWVSFYSSAAAREGDAGRPFSKDPPPGSGVLLDLATTASELTITAPPGGTYFSSEPPSSSPAPLRALVRNTGTARVAIALSVNVVVLAP